MSYRPINKTYWTKNYSEPIITAYSSPSRATGGADVFSQQNHSSPHDKSSCQAIGAISLQTQSSPRNTYAVAHASCALVCRRGPRPGNDGLLRGDHADDNLQNLRHLCGRGHLLRRTDLRRNPHDERPVCRTRFRDSSARCSALESSDGALAGLARSPVRRCSRWRP